MKRNKWLKRIFSIAVGMALIATTALPALAGETPTGDLPDPDETGSVTVHKYSTPSASKVPGQGLELDAVDAAALGTPLADVGFTLHVVNDDVTVDHTTTAQGLLDAGAGLTSLGEVMTDGGGVAAWADLPVGYYVLEESTPPEGDKLTTAAPAIITLPMGITATGSGWNYDIHVYPKNVKTDDISKEVTSSGTCYTVGDTISWKIDGKVKTDLRAGEEGSYTYGGMNIIDPLDSRLDYTADSDVVTLVGGTTYPSITLVRGTDYTLTNDENTYTWTLTNAGIDKVMADSAAAISVTFDTVVNENARNSAPSGTTGITNGASVDWISAETGEETTASIDDEDKPSVELARVEFLLKDYNNQEILLDGGEFKIALSQEDALAGIYLKDANGDDIVAVTGNNSETTDTIEQGWACFMGLPMNADADQPTKFYLVQTVAPTNYILPQSVVELSIPAGEKTVSTVVFNQKIGDPPMPEENPTFQLPQTGGMGTVLFIIIGLALMGGAVVILIKNRKKKAQDSK